MTHFYHKQSRFVRMFFPSQVFFPLHCYSTKSIYEDLCSFIVVFELIRVIEFGYKKQILFVGNTS